MSKPFKDQPDSIPLRGGPADGMLVPNEGNFKYLFAEPEKFNPFEKPNITDVKAMRDVIHVYWIHPEGFYEYQGVR